MSLATTGLKLMLLSGNATKGVSLSNLPEEAWTILTGQAVGKSANVLDCYEEVPWLRRGVDLVRDAVADLPYQFEQNGKAVEVERLPFDLDLHGLLEVLAMDLMLHGAGYVSKGLNLIGIPRDVRRLLPTSVHPKFSDGQGLIGFERAAGSQRMFFTADELVYIWLPNARSELGPGPSPVRSALKAAGVLRNMDAYLEGHFERGTIDPTVVVVPTGTSDPERDRIENWFRRTATGIKNAFKVLAVTAELKILQLTRPLKDLAAPELIDKKREDVATALGVPHSLLFSNAANYACLPGDQRVYTPAGAIPIADVVAGDVIYQFDPDKGVVENTVTQITLQGEAPVYEIRTSNRVLRASDNHLIMAVQVTPGTGNGRGNTTQQKAELIWKRTDQLVIGDIIVTAEELPDQEKTVVDGVVITEELMEIAGLYIGDGDMTQRRTMRFAIPEGKEQDIYARKAESVFTRAYTGYGELKATRQHYTFKINSAEACRLFERLGFVGDALTKRLPAWVYSLNRGLRLAFLRGYLDSDGYVDKNRGSIIYASANLDLLADVRALCISCGIPVSNLMHDTGRIGNFGEIRLFRFTCGYPQYNRLIGSNHPVKAVRLTANSNGHRDGRYRPRETYNIRNFELPPGFGVSKVVSVDYIGEMDVYDLSTTETHTFIAEGVVVHNTAQQDDLHFYTKTVVPMARRIAAALNTQLFAPYGVTLVFQPEKLEIFQVLEAQKADKLEISLRNGAITVAEFREQMGFAPLPAPVSPALPTGGDETERPAVVESRAEMVKTWQDDLRRWQRMAVKRYAEGKPGKAQEFTSDVLDPALAASVRGALAAAATADEAAAVFANALTWGVYP